MIFPNLIERQNQLNLISLFTSVFFGSNLKKKNQIKASKVGHFVKKKSENEDCFKHTLLDPNNSKNKN